MSGDQYPILMGHLRDDVENLLMEWVSDLDGVPQDLILQTVLEAVEHFLDPGPPAGVLSTSTRRCWPAAPLDCSWDGQRWWVSPPGGSARMLTHAEFQQLYRPVGGRRTRG